jgi:hypothetical protein
LRRDSIGFVRMDSTMTRVWPIVDFLMVIG